MTLPNHLRALGAAIAVSCAIGAGGCATSGNPVSAGSVATDAGTLANNTAFCVEEVNRYRASVGVAPLTRSSRIDEFSTNAAHVDGEAHQAHTYFLMTNGGNGTASAENVIPWWKTSQYGSVRAIVTKGLATMWAEGPGGDHYENMKGNYSEMGCGIFTSNDEITVSQDFY
jgi:uncharacterized protein YkwD